jgi:hypothetical protein
MASILFLSTSTAIASELFTGAYGTAAGAFVLTEPVDALPAIFLNRLLIAK